MRPKVIGLAAALLLAALAPAVVMSAPKAPPAVTEAARKQGMAEAPAIAQAAGISCQVTDARFVGKATDPKTKIATSYYEIDCDQGQGFVLSSATGAKPTAFTCVEADTPQPDGKPSALPCVLPGNADPKADLAPLLAKAGIQCTPEAARGIGQSATNTFLEVACQGGSGYVVQAPAPAVASLGNVTANDCLLYDSGEGNIHCTLKDKASRLAVVDGYAAAANNGCAVKDRRFVGMSQSGSSFYEASCADGKGYIYKADKGQLATTYPCEKATGILGGCTLTDAREAETAQAGLYTKLAKTAGFDCQVSKYAPFPGPPGKDVVEMACSNRPDGGVGVFGGPADKPIVYDCGRAPIAGYRCSFTKPADTMAVFTADLKKLGKDSCNVSATRVIGKTTKGTTYVETACADGLKGYVLEYTADPINAVGVVGCAFTKDCKLPGNV
ncbi:hypothetical protein [Phenylobacterium aquaticum]|uniref:hypothetical protein n=1 Tax=Phenylobacterium aquaticum TaxID=1763816 RepID=UPI001F5E2454|nr:hypothetical protein [Phenylobacterium aquaticum]MCI3131310.1 hypothetical protein [Phenylobacterium aquaticum]